MPSRPLFAILLGLIALGTPARGQQVPDAIDPALAKVQSDDPKTLWYDFQLLDVEGQGWPQGERKAAYDRLPAKAEGVVPDPVWNLSHQSAGICARFVTDATKIQARWSLTSKNLALPHMPSSGVSGLDLYVKDGDRWRNIGFGWPKEQSGNAETLLSGIPEGTREYLLYLPLYNGVTSVEIGIPQGTSLAKAPARPEGKRKPIVFYGTSITQGGCASRPGMVHTAILGRRLGHPVINLGFSGNGRMEPALAELLAELDPAVYILDCLPNMGAKEVEERVVPFVRILRKARPDTPIVLAEDRTYTYGFLIASRLERNQASRAALKKAYEQLTAEEVKGLTYLPGDIQLNEDGEGTVDNSHPTDLGFVQMADAFAPFLAPLLSPQEGKE